MKTEASRPAVGVIGLGLLGSAICERLLAAGYRVVGYDIEAEACQNLLDAGGTVSDFVTDVPTQCQRILLSLPDSGVVRRVLGQIRPLLGAAADLLDTTTGAPADTEQIAGEMSRAGARWLDATVVGSSEQMRRGEAIMLVGGPTDAYRENLDLLETLSQRAFHVGANGSGARMKLVVNLVIGLHRAVLAEGLSLAKSYGFDLLSTLEILRSSAAYSRMMDTKGEKMIREEFSPQARLAQHLKDVELILSSGREHGAKLPLSHLHRELLAGLRDDGFGDLDNSAIIKAFDGESA